MDGRSKRTKDASDDDDDELPLFQLQMKRRTSDAKGVNKNSSQRNQPKRRLSSSSGDGDGRRTIDGRRWSSPSNSSGGPKRTLRHTMSILEACASPGDDEPISRIVEALRIKKAHNETAVAVSRRGGRAIATTMDPTTLFPGTSDSPSYRQPESSRGKFEFEESVLVDQSLGRDCSRSKSPSTTAEVSDSPLIRSDRFNVQVDTGSESSIIVNQSSNADECRPNVGLGIPESLKRGKFEEDLQGAIMEKEVASVAKQECRTDLYRSPTKDVAIRPNAHSHTPQDEEGSSLLSTVSVKKRKNQSLKNQPAIGVQPGQSTIDPLLDTSTRETQAHGNAKIDGEWSMEIKSSPSNVERNGNPDPKRVDHVNPKRRKLEIGSSGRALDRPIGSTEPDETAKDDDTRVPAQFVDGAKQRSERVASASAKKATANGRPNLSSTLFFPGQPILDDIAEREENDDKQRASVEHTFTSNPESKEYVCDEIRVKQRNLEVSSCLGVLANDDEPPAFLESPWSSGPAAKGRVCDQPRDSKRKVDTGSHKGATPQSSGSSSHKETATADEIRIPVQYSGSSEYIEDCVAVVTAATTDSLDSPSSASNQASLACFDDSVLMEQQTSESDDPNRDTNQHNTTSGGLAELVAVQMNGEPIRITIKGDFMKRVGENGVASMIKGEAEPMMHEKTSSGDLTQDPCIQSAPILTTTSNVEATESMEESPGELQSSSSCESRGNGNNTNAVVCKKLIVHCGGGYHEEPGNVALSGATTARIREYISADAQTKTLIISEFMEMFEFIQGNDKAPQKFVKSKLRKMLGDLRRLRRGKSVLSPEDKSYERRETNLARASGSQYDKRQEIVELQGDCDQETVSEGKLVVYCGGAHLEHLGNREYIKRVGDFRLSFLASNALERQYIILDFLDRFYFLRPSEGKWNRAAEVWAKDKVNKALSDGRLAVHQSRVEDKYVPSVESQHLHRFTDKDTKYIEELAFHHYAALDPTKCEEEPLPPPLPIPEPPRDDVSVTWKYDESSRIFLGDFSKVEFVSDVHKRFLGELMERDDITVICEGLLDGFQDDQDFLDSIERSFRNDPHHKFRRFVRTEKNGKVLHHEIDGYVSIKISEFRAYLRMLSGETEKRSFVIRDQSGLEEVIAAENAREHVFYMIDVDMPKMMIRLNDEYKRNFKIKEILPGGAWCMLNHLAEQSRPFMGPNCYITPGGGYTQVHQDGHGSVDSGHSNIKGFNEVVMLRRLPECHKRIACRMVPSFEESCDKIKDQNMLYRLPHDDGREDKPKWPTHKTIESWRAKNYCPSVFILKEGQHVLINKGRLHAFRKLTSDPLPQSDCHALLRAELVQSKNWKASPLCVSIAFDWMFIGITPEGINREAASTLECTALCRKNKCKSLAIPETSILKLASGLPKEVDAIQREKLLLHKAPTTDSEFRATWLDIARGILPSLRHIVKKEVNTTITSNMKRHLSSHNEAVPDSTLDSSRAYVDPFGNDYFCKLCDHELSNTYYHCEGCELLLSKDFNICALCFGEKRFMEDILMHDGKNKEMHSNRHHVGQPKLDCKCDGNDATCEHCNRSMTCCCCICHTVFSKRHRFYSPNDLKEILKDVEKVVGENEIEFAVETEHRLNRVVMVPADTGKHCSATENSDCEARVGSTVHPASEGNDGP